MEFEHAALHDAEEKYWDMLNGVTHSPFSNSPHLSSYGRYTGSRARYCSRLESEKNNFNSAVRTVNNHKASRLQAIADEKQRIADAKEKRRYIAIQASITIAFLLPVLLFITVGLIMLINPIVIFQYIHYGWIIAVYIIILVICVIASVVLLIKDSRKNYSTLFMKCVKHRAISLIGCGAFALILMIVSIACMKNDFHIENVTQFNVISNIPNPESRNYYIESDIDFDGIAPSWSGQMEDFQGVIDGRGHVLSNIKYQNNGIFARMNHGTIKNISINGALFDETYANNDMTVINGDCAIGTIVGFNYGEICNIKVANSYLRWARYDMSYSNTKSDYCYLGGIVGLNNGGKIERCEYYNDNSNSSYKYSIYLQVKLANFGSGQFGPVIGGIVGGTKGGEIVDCVNGGATLFSNIASSAGTPLQATGGLIGLAESDVHIERCISFAYCNADRQNSYSGHKYEGVFVAKVNAATFRDCYSGIGNCWTIGNNQNGADGVVRLSSDEVAVSDLPSIFSHWSDTAHGYPSPYRM